MKKVFGFLCLSVIISNMSLYAETWSSFMGNMNWNSANVKCRSIGMRLPSIDELQSAYNTEINNSWKNDGYYFWSSTPYDSMRYYRLDATDGTTDHIPRNLNSAVRCRR